MPCLPYQNTPAKEIGCKRSSSNKNTGVLNYPTFKTYGVKNPYYKCFDFYLLQGIGRYVNRCQLEDYFADFIDKGISIDPNVNLLGYYNSIVSFVRAAYNKLVFELKIKYSNLSIECSAILLIKRVLAKILCEEEAARIITLYKLDQSCDLEFE